MIAALKALFLEEPAKETEQALEHRLQLVAAVLLIETARADFTENSDEQRVLEELLCNTLALDKAEIQPLVELATEHLDSSTSLYEFTRLINDHYQAKQKRQLVYNMWLVAFADGSIDKYEDHLIRGVSELIYVSHQDFIGAKLSAQKTQAGNSPEGSG